MPSYDFTRTPSIATANVSVPVGPQLFSNNSGFSLVQQFNSSNVHNASINVSVPQHFSNVSPSAGKFQRECLGILNFDLQLLVVAYSDSAASFVLRSHKYTMS